MPKIVSIGEILVEIMSTKINQTFLSTGFFEGPFPSGAPAIFADSAAKMGGDVGVISSVGNDDFGELNIRRLKQDKVDTSRIKILSKQTTGTAFVTYFDSGERQFIFHFGAAGHLSFDTDDKEYLRSSEYLHIMGCTLLSNENNRNAVLNAARYSKENGILISFDPNIRPELLAGSDASNVFEEILNLTDILLTGKEEIKSISGTCDVVKGALTKMFDKSTKIIVIKNGRENVELYTKEQYYVCETRDYGEMADQTGAGDCFDGAFIAALSQNYSLENALLMASTAGSVSVTKKGPMEGTSDLDYVKNLIARKLSITI